MKGDRKRVKEEGKEGIKRRKRRRKESGKEK